MIDPLCLSDRSAALGRVEPMRDATPALAAAAPMLRTDDVRADSPRGDGPRAGECSHTDCAMPPAREQAAWLEPTGPRPRGPVGYHPPSWR